MAERGIIMEIAGQQTALISHTIANVGNAASWSNAFVEAIASIPTSQGMRVDPFTGTFDSQGTSIELNQLASFLMERKTSLIKTDLTANLEPTDTTINVTSTGGYAASGYIWLGSECIYYASKTGTSFTSCVRGSLGTYAKKWTSLFDSRALARRQVYASNPFFVGRRATLKWYDLNDPSSTSLRFTGYIDNPRFSSDGFSLDLINGKKLLEDAEVMSGRFARGKLLGGFLPRDKQINYENYDSSRHNQFLIDIESEEYSFPAATQNSPKYLQIDEEIIAYTSTTAPALSGEVIAVASGVLGNYFEVDVPFAPGDIVKYSTGGTLYRVMVIKVESGTSGKYRCWHNGGTNPAALDTVTASNKQSIGPTLFAGNLRTRRATHESGAECKEIRVLKGDHVDLVLRLLLSTGSGNNGSWDTLQEGWGAGVPQSLVDTTAFQKLRDYSDTREMIFDSAAKANDLLAILARVTASRIFWNASGVLTVNLERDIYPDSSGVLTIDYDSVADQGIPAWSAPTSNLYNSWVMRGNSPRGKDYADILNFVDEESRDRYGQRSLPDLDDGGLLIAQSANKLEIIGKAAILRWAHPTIHLECDLLFDESNSLTPGQLIAITFSHMPDMKAASGLTAELFEVMEVFPKDPDGTISVVVIQMPPIAETRLTGPAGEVSGLSGAIVTLKQTSTTHYSPADPPTGIEPLSSNSQPGEEDVDWFSVGMAIRIFDASTLGNATPNEHATTIETINYGTREITLASLPGWTIAAGDIVVYDDYTAVQSATAPLLDVFAWLAAGNPPVLNSGDPHVWGL